ncbi:hypothetical protein C8N46_103295 [Kordia periserrulae]|uniref:Uncharacterized protein n=1 Tax=Kordia periserrulae TaxID=701523 RepID=A0A2T6C1K5_9FLAO|nr:hypothetical protein [Kordia periserrulae]PTX62196.1 hypothetical protein C8N46_103295 [Kordia periserrulae]
MKKRELKNLKLNKNSISSMERSSPIGGYDSNNRQCYSEQNITACYWDPRCESISPRACY